VASAIGASLEATAFVPDADDTEDFEDEAGGGVAKLKDIEVEEDDVEETEDEDYDGEESAEEYESGDEGEWSEDV